MKKLLFILLTFFTTALSAQHKIDSLKEVLKKEKNDSATIYSWLMRMDSMTTTDMDASLAIGNWSAATALETKNYFLYVKSLLAIAGIYHLTNDFPNAIDYYIKTQEAAEKYKQVELGLETLNNLANVYYLNNQYDKAEQFYKITIAACEKQGITIGVATGYGSLASIYFSTGAKNRERIKEGIGYMMKSIQASKSLKDTTQLIRSFSSLGKMYSGIQLFDSALNYIDKAGSLMTAKKDNQEGYTYYYCHKGTVLLKKGDYKAAIESFLTGLPYTKKFNALLWESSHYEGLSQAYKAIGDYKTALEYGERHFIIEDSVINAENFGKAADIQNKYERLKKDKALLQKDLELKKELMKRNNLLLWLISSLVILGLLSVFSLLLIRNIKARKKAYHELEKRNSEIKEQALQLSRQARLIAKFQSQMNPHFTFNALHSIYGLVIGNENEKAVTQIQSLAQLMRKTLTNSIKEEITLEEEMDYLQKYIEFEKATSATSFDFIIQVGAALENVLIPPMMIQPFIENAIKHAGLDKVKNPFIKVLIEKENDLMMLIIEDNGRGLNKDNTNVNKLSHSMSIIKSRIELLFESKKNIAGDSYFKILSVPEITNGTAVKFYLPLHYAY